MYSLILDTSANELGVALYIEEKCLCHISFECFRKQSETLVSEIQKILIHKNVNPSLVSKIYVNNGPGSYTGIRMSLAVAKTFSFVFDTQIFLVSSLLAQTGYVSDETVSLIDARAGRCYFGISHRGEVREQKVIHMEELREFLAQNPGIPIVGNFSLADRIVIPPKTGIVGIGEILGAVSCENNPLRVEPFYFKEAV